MPARKPDLLVEAPLLKSDGQATLVQPHAPERHGACSAAVRRLQALLTPSGSTGPNSGPRWACKSRYLHVIHVDFEKQKALALLDLPSPL